MMSAALRFRAAVILALGLFLSGAVDARERLRLRHEVVSLPGAPTVVLPTDIDGDGVQDLVVAVAYTEWDQIGIDEMSEMRGVEGLVMVMTVVPVVMDKREVRVYLGREQGGYDESVPPLPIDLSVVSLDHGPPEEPVVLLTDDGIAALRLTTVEGTRTLQIVPLVASRPVLARSGTLIPHLGLSHDLDGDSRRDLLFPVNSGLDVYLADQLTRGGSAKDRAVLPGDRSWPGKSLSRFYPLPVIRDVNGDRLPDLLVPDLHRGWERFDLLLNRGDGRFGEAFSPVGRSPDARAPDHGGGEPNRAVIEIDPAAESEQGPDPRAHTGFPIVYFGDLDGDGIAEYVTEESLEDEDAGWRKEIKEAKRPPRRYRLHHSEPDLSMQRESYQEFEALGYALDLHDSDIRLPGGFQDLDGDGLQDLVTLTLDFSLMQAVRIMTTQRLGIGLDFHVFCQTETGKFREVTGMDLSGKFKINLKNLQLGQLSQFEGDFDGDGKVDFLQAGRGRSVTIHRGQEGCRYPTEPDMTIKLQSPPLDLSLVRVQDLNADGLSDLMIIQPEPEPEPGVSPPVRLDLYLSGEGRP